MTHDGKKRHGLRAWLSLAAAITSFAFTTTAVNADMSDKLFSAMKTALTSSIPPDQIEMAKYAIGHPENAAVVFARAAAQDYGFFALVGAVKAAKKHSFPKIGEFTKDKCNIPITAIDAVFAKASSTIDDTPSSHNKSKVDAAVNQARALGVQYAQATLPEAKKQLIEQLSQNVPYFGDIPVICDFAFNTEFQAERNLQNVVSGAAKAIKTSYQDFKSGDVIGGVGALTGIGVGADVACGLVDEAVSGGAIGNVPGLNKLVTGVCSGFVGKVLDGAKGVVKFGYKVAKAGYCAVLSLFGDGCSSAEPPPTGYSEAYRWCQPYGGMKALLTRSNAPNDYSVTCNDGAQCRVEPGKQPRCATAAELAALGKSQIAQNDADFATKLPLWSSQFEGRWLDKCQDEQCRTAIKILRLNTVLTGQQRHAADPHYPYAFMSLQLMITDENAQKVIAESAQRANAFNQKTTTNAAGGWEQLAVGVWTKQCADVYCPSEIKSLAEEMKKAAIARQAAQPESSSLSVQGAIGKEYGPKFQKAVDNSKLRANPATPPDAKLIAMGCQHFLGRARQYLCTGIPQAYLVCVDYVKSGAADKCLAPNQPMYPPK